MAKDILYISNGADIDAAWTGHIAVSGDGNNWDLINKTGLSVGKHSVNVNDTVATGQIKENSFIITIKRSDSDGSILKFNPAKVLNQLPWLTPGTGATQALTDIATWIVTV